ncbi:MAG: hypothetical protein WCG53_00150 [Actinomycetes bacterium]
MKKNFITALFFLVVITISHASAATKPIPVRPLATSFALALSGGDQLSDVLTNASGTFLIGTIETSTSTLVTSPALGGTSDGYISAVSYTGQQLWNLRLGTVLDDVATSGYIDSLGNIWVAGATAIPTPQVTPTPLAPNTVNPSQILVAPVAPPTSGLKRLVVWEISPSGSLVNTYTSDSTDVLLPSTITLKLKKIVVSGVSNSSGANTFESTISTTGLSPIKLSKQKTLPNKAVTLIKSSTYSWQSFATSKAIPGISGFKPKGSTSVLIKSSLKGGIAELFTFNGKLVSLKYQPGFGLVLANSDQGIYSLLFLNTK